MLISGRRKTWNGCRTGHQSRLAWPDLTLLAPEKGREMVSWASWRLTVNFPATPRQCYCLQRTRIGFATKLCIWDPREDSSQRAKWTLQSLFLACKGEPFCIGLRHQKRSWLLKRNSEEWTALGREAWLWSQAGQVQSLRFSLQLL